MKKGFLGCFFAVFVLSAASGYSSPFDLISVGDPVINDIRFISLETGIPILSFTPPFSPHKIRNFLEAVDFNSLSVAAQKAYDRIEGRLNRQSRISTAGRHFLFTIDLKVAVDANVRFNTDIDWFPYNFHVPPFLSAPMRFHFSDFVQLYFEPVIAVDPEFFRGTSGSFYTGRHRTVGHLSHNIPHSVSRLDTTVPLRAYIAMGGPWWSFQLGRDRLSFGSGMMGNLTISDNPFFYEFARLSFFTDFFKYTLLVNQSPLDVRGVFDIRYPYFPNPDRTTQRYFYLHRFDFTLFNRLSIGISEGLIVGYSPLELRFLNPLMIFHSFFAWWQYGRWDGGYYAPPGNLEFTSSLLSIEINWNIARSLFAYGQFVMNQLTLALEAGDGGYGIPNGVGFMAGVRFSHSLPSGWGSLFTLEFIHTSPFLYMGASPFASFIKTRQLDMQIGRLHHSFFGFARDTIALALDASFFDRDIVSFSAGFMMLIQGESSTTWWNWAESEEAFLARTPTGVPQNNFIFSFDAKWRFSPRFTVTGGIAGIYSQNNRHNEGQNEFGGQFSFGVRFWH